MGIDLKKREIREEIENITDEKLIWAIAQLLHLDDEGEAPERHKSVVRERGEKYEKGKGKMLDWDDMQKDL